MSHFLSLLISVLMVGFFACKKLPDDYELSAVVNQSQTNAIGIVSVRARLAMPQVQNMDAGMAKVGQLIDQPIMALILCAGSDAVKKVQAAESKTLYFDVVSNDLYESKASTGAKVAGCSRLANINYPVLDEFFAVAYTLAKFGDLAQSAEEGKDFDRNSFRMAQLIYLSLRGTYHQNSPNQVSQALGGVSGMERFHLKAGVQGKLAPFLAGNIAQLDKWFNPCDKTGNAKIDKNEFMACLAEGGSKTAFNYLPKFGSASPYPNFDMMKNELAKHIEHTFQLKSGAAIDMINGQGDKRSKAMEALNMAIINYQVATAVTPQEIPVANFVSALSGKGDASVLASFFQSNVAQHQEAAAVFGETMDDTQIAADLQGKPSTTQNQQQGLGLRGWYPGRGLQRWGQSRMMARQNLANTTRWRPGALVFPRWSNAVYSNGAGNRPFQSVASTCQSCAGGRCSSCSTFSNGSCGTCPSCTG